MCPDGGRVVVRPATRTFVVHREHTSGEEVEYIAVLVLLGMMLPFANEPHRERHVWEYGVNAAPKSAVAGADCCSGQAQSPLRTVPGVCVRSDLSAWPLWRKPQAGFVPVSCDQRLPHTRREVVRLSGRRHPNLEDAITEEVVRVFVAVVVGGFVVMFHFECHAGSVARRLARNLRLTTAGCRLVPVPPGGLPRDGIDLVGDPGAGVSPMGEGSSEPLG